MGNGNAKVDLGDLLALLDLHPTLSLGLSSVDPNDVITSRVPAPGTDRRIP